MRKRLHFDFETFSKCALRKHGIARYARDVSTEVLMLAWTLNHGETLKQWDITKKYGIPNEFLDALADERIEKVAWNCQFEQNITEHVLCIPVDYRDWYDPMILARSLSLPAALKDVCPVLNMPESEWKESAGTSLISWFCVPRKPTKKDLRIRNMPLDNKRCIERWDEFLFYNRQDVRAEIGALDRMSKFDMLPEEWALWFLDRDINERGVPVNLKAIENAKEITRELSARKLDELDDLTGLENSNSGEQLLEWLKARDYPFEDLKVGHVKRAYAEAKEDGDGGTRYGKALKLRTEVSKASVKKYEAYSNYACDDGVVRNMHVFGGAGRTLRWSGSGVQLQNMLRPVEIFEKPAAQEQLAHNIQRMSPDVFEYIYDEPMDALGSGCRGMIQAPAGHLFVSADFNAIENRVVGWVAGEERILQVFLDDRDPYVDFATYMFGKPYDEIMALVKAGQKKMRKDAKPAVLGCGFMLSAGFEYEDKATGEMLATGLLGYARNMGVHMTPEESERNVKVWRETYSKVVQFWYDIHDAVWECIESRKTTKHGMFTIRYEAPFLTIELPSGRKLFYLRPRIEDRKTPWGEIRPTITYEGYDNKEQPGKKFWTRVATHPGKITENIVQAIARDLLAVGLVRAKEVGLDVRLHVHDEIVCLARISEAERHAELLSRAMAEPTDWNFDLPLKADAEISRIFVKT